MTLRARLARARRRYAANRTNDNLRSYLTLKARLRQWDTRYCAHYGVSPNVNRGCRRAIMRAYAAGLVPTSTKRLPVSATSSYHRRRNPRGLGMAVDLGVRRELVGTAEATRRLTAFQAAEHRRQRAAAGTIGGEDLVELIGPDDRLVVLRDRETDLAHGSPLEVDHRDHVHEAYLG